MRRRLSLLAVLAAASVPATAAAQVGPAGPGGRGVYRSAPLSPYLGLLNGGNTPAFNYYGFVRPRQRIDSQGRAFSQTLERQRAELAAVRSGVVRAVDAPPTLLLRQPAAGVRGTGPTGHTTRFGNTSGFFPGRR